MTNAERLLAAIRRHPGATDAELRIHTGVHPHQQVNQICHRLATGGDIVRRERADGRIGNFPGNVSQVTDQPPATAATQQRYQSRSQAATRTPSSPLPPPRSTLVVIPCSGTKALGGAPRGSSAAVSALVPPPLAHELAEARRRVAFLAQVDETSARPAIHRYRGALYATAGPAIAHAVDDGQPLVILSGGYGVLHPHEEIGTYDRAIAPSDWPRGLLGRALVEVCRSLDLREIVAFCGRTTRYANVVRRHRWERCGITARIVAPRFSGGGAMRLVPATLGEALVAYLDGGLDEAWTSSRGAGLAVEML
ncbi:hypothetical protein [Actinomarinicola tropica]|uniref:Uncharacterized protein n=1 Tax=Actinomarinicola tropica TaxID=2789776 RepID=A0A5Q2RMG2_9ACTN|nr:hypothetical protein [Actinomarinicola tropica]QGG94375.1 hypothetical protein GH723_04240 [Actinomarinicola tropica]